MNNKQQQKPLSFFPAARPPQKSAYQQIEINAPPRYCFCKYLCGETRNTLVQ